MLPAGDRTVFAFPARPRVRLAHRRPPGLTRHCHMTDQQMADQTAGVPSREPAQDLVCLAKGGVSPSALKDAHGLWAMILDELDVPEEAAVTGSKVSVLETVLWAVVDEAREEALAELGKELAPETRPAFQVAAAAELLNLHDEQVFKIVREQRDKEAKRGDTWQEVLQRLDKKGPTTLRRLRASAWLGKISHRTVAPDRRQPELLAALESAIRTYVANHREQLTPLLRDA